MSEKSAWQILKDAISGPQPGQREGETALGAALRQETEVDIRTVQTVAQNLGIELSDQPKAINLTGQEILLKNLKTIHTSVSPVFKQSNQTLTPESLESAIGRNKYVLPCSDMSPETIISRLTDPTSMKPFHNATPAQLSSLQPTLRFFIVSNEDAEKKKTKQEEVYFSDFTKVDRIIKLANARASNVLDKTLRQGGSEAGIKSFNWKYHNKHEGDKIIEADLELYFGTLSELVNLNYLNFLFTNGRKSSIAPSIKKEYNRQQKLNELNKENNKLLNSLLPKSKIAGVNEKINNDFRQLKVVVGWAVPQGSPANLARLYGPNWKSFLKAVKATQRVILLNLTNYDVNFSQEGPTTLKLEYVGSSDNFLSSPASDVLGQNNFSKGNLNEQQVFVSTEDIDTKSLFPFGYIKHQIDKFHVEEQNIVPVRMDRVNREHQYLMGLREYLKLQTDGSKPKKKTQKELENVEKQLNVSETIYKSAKKALRIKRYATLMNNLIGGTGQASKVYMSSVARDSIGGIVFNPGEKETSGQGGTDFSARLNKLSKLSAEERTKFLKSNSLSPEYTFKRGSISIVDEQENSRQYLSIPYVFLGDIILAAMETSDMRDDIKFILGTYSPKNLGIPGFEGDNTNYPLYDIPVALDYLSQFIYDNIISKEIDELPFRQFIDSLLSTVSRLLNNLSSFRFRISFDYTIYMTENEIKTKGEEKSKKGKTGKGKDFILNKNRINEIRPNLKNAPLINNNKINSYYIIFARQTNDQYNGNRDQDEKRGIYHYTLGADRGIAKNFNFSKQDVPQFKALNIEAIYSGPNAANFAQALILPQNVSIEMFGNSIHKNGDLIYVDSRAALGELANQILALGGYYRVVRSSNNISSSGFTTTVDAVFQHRTNSRLNPLER